MLCSHMQITEGFAKIEIKYDTSISKGNIEIGQSKGKYKNWPNLCFNCNK